MYGKTGLPKIGFFLRHIHQLRLNRIIFITKERQVSSKFPRELTIILEWGCVWMLVLNVKL